MLENEELDWLLTELSVCFKEGPEVSGGLLLQEVLECCGAERSRRYSLLLSIPFLLLN